MKMKYNVTVVGADGNFQEFKNCNSYSYCDTYLVLEQEDVTTHIHTKVASGFVVEVVEE